ncbi:MAG TPA: PQQ-dependent sugar dehydrogenase [Chryseolinea sp.]|nr:PQQ-dependent sugar dehydrogenase [Chryseolinea sp.]
MNATLKVFYFLFICSVFLFCCFFSCSKQRETFLLESEGLDLEVEVVSDSISVPFGMAFLPDGKLLVTDRPNARMILVNVDAGTQTNIDGLPPILASGDGGMLEVIVHPDFKNNQTIYYSYSSIRTDSTSTMTVDRARLDGTRIVDSERIFSALPYYKEPNHFGCRLLLKDGYLFITMGERYFLRDSAQTLSNHLGKVLRLLEDGSIPSDNPFVNTKGALPEIWSYGHRNPQGLTINPLTGELWEHEHGPKGGDEINIIRPALNYGWPVICHGIDYDDTPIGDGIKVKEGMEQPFYYYVPSIAPSGMEFYTAEAIPQWKGNLFIGAMALKHLNRLVIEGNKVVREDRLLTEKNWRIRCVKQGPDGFLYLSIDNGCIVRIKPKH